VQPSPSPADPGQVSKIDRWLTWLRQPMQRSVLALGITQIIGWGTTVYALGVLSKPIVDETGWRTDLVIAGITVALLASGLVSTSVGRLIDRRSGRFVMMIGSAAIAALQVALAVSGSVPFYLAAWALLGVAMRMSLYDAAFVALVQVNPIHGRTAISYLTLFGSFASTIFWPIGHALAQLLGWRATFLVFAAMNLLICLPLHWWGLGARESSTTAATKPGPAAPAAATRSTVLDGAARRVAMVLFAIVISACAFAFGALAVLLPAVLEASGISRGEAVFLASVKGFAQFFGRVCEIRYGRNLGILTVGRFAVACLPLSFAFLLFGGGGFAMALVFTLLFGVSNGLLTIVRGAVPLVLFGPVGYGAVLGLLATPYLIMNASAPVLLAALVEQTSYVAGEWVLLASGVVAVAAMEIMAVWYQGLQRRQS
jgi:predicted MFS family arabinose efflux permease